MPKELHERDEANARHTPRPANTIVRRRRTASDANAQQGPSRPVVVSISTCDQQYRVERLITKRRNVIIFDCICMQAIV